MDGQPQGIDIGVGGSNIKSIQNGVSSMGTGVGYIDVTISAIDITKTVVIVTDGYETSGNYPYDGYCKMIAWAINSTTIRIVRGVTNANVNNINWQVIEFNNVKSLQTGGMSLYVSNGDLTVNQYDPAKSILIYSYNLSTTTNSDYTVSLFKNGSNKIGYKSFSSYSVSVRWQLIEFN
ncbi:hypothetical protein ACWI_32900 [Acetobacterium wieringae]|uniref:Uncharacterized protein n=1 Tax=Acetobacterium wieringae TaxID=52694 RepID=A0A1F2PEY3_9FIRM|nr:hypothetical protein ACWI_32900 [Acetobacterium wieringae]